MTHCCKRPVRHPKTAQASIELGQSRGQVLKWNKGSNNLRKKRAQGRKQERRKLEGRKEKKGRKDERKEERIERKVTLER